MQGIFLNSIEATRFVSIRNTTGQHDLTLLGGSKIFMRNFCCVTNN